jgi:transcriptional regulator with XRE-family HTH domain
MGTNPSPDPKSSMWAWIAYNLRVFRTQRGQSGDAIGKILNCSKATVSRLESGETKLEETQAATLDRAWNTGGLFSIMLWYARLGHDPDWMKQHVNIEARAYVHKIWELVLIPGLLQTEDYARATLVTGGVKDVEGALETRMRRQEILAREEPPILWVLLFEGVLDVPVGGAAIMRKQLAHLLEASESPNIAVRVVPRSAGAHLGLEGAFKIMTVETGDVAYMEALGGGRLVPSATEVRSYAISYDRISQQALPEGPSRDLIKRVMEAIQ